MFEAIDQSRRNLLKFGGLGLLTLAITKVKADSLTELIAPTPANQIISVRLWPSNVYTRLTIESENEAEVKYFSLTLPNRFVIDILNAQLNAVLKDLSAKVLAKDPIISEVKVGQFKPDTVRIVVYLKQHIMAQNKSLEPVDFSAIHYKYRYLIDMYPNTQVEQSSQPLNDELLAFLQLNHDLDNKPSITTNSHQTLSRMVSKISRSSIGLKRPILVMIDPGHGGEDPGAIGHAGTREKDVVLDIGHKLYDLINQSGTMQAQMTRSQDIFIPLATRVAIARKAKADVFISIHADGFILPTARGSSVFILSDHGASSSFAKWLAKTQNASDLIGGMTYGTTDKNLGRILLDMSQTWTKQKSNCLGEILLGKMRGINKLHSKQVETAAFAVLKAPDIPSTLVETAFISNPEEEAKLKTAQFRQEVALTLFNGLTNFAKILSS